MNVNTERVARTAVTLTMTLLSPTAVRALQVDQPNTIAADTVATTLQQQQENGLEVRIGALTLFSRRNAQLAGRVGKGSGVHPGVELFLWAPRVWGSSADDRANSTLGVTSLGLHGRIIGGRFSSDSTPDTPGNEAVGEVNNADLEVFVGRPVLHARLGYGVRSFSGDLGTRRWSFFRVGARSTFTLGSSREFEVTLGAAFYVGVTGDPGGSGREGETRLTFVPQCEGGGDLTSWLCRRLTGSVAYRFEQFTVRADPASGGDRPEEVSSVVIGVGIRL